MIYYNGLTAPDSIESQFLLYQMLHTTQSFYSDRALVLLFAKTFHCHLFVF